MRRVLLVFGSAPVVAGKVHISCQRRCLSSLFRATAVLHQLESPALEAARRLNSASQAFPATGPLNVMPPEDPRIEWREYWATEESAPYYHNIKTNEVTWDIPEGFVTRFISYHSNQEGVVVTPDGRVARVAAPKEGEPQLSPEEQMKNRKLSLKQKLALYGSGGLVLYLIIHNTCLTIVFVSIYFLGVDLVGLAKSYGFNVKGGHGANSADQVDATKKKMGFFSTFIVAVLLNKLTVPIQLTLTLILAPRFVPKLQPFANRMAPRIRKWFPYLPFGKKKQ